jgi:predicted porin
VQVYGVVDMAVSNYRGAGAGSRQMLTSSGNQASRLGFKGREDLGSGLAAGFDLEAGLNTDNGTGQASTPTTSLRGQAAATV